MRSHLHAILLLPLAVVITTWPLFPRLFDRDNFWLHTNHRDAWLELWDAWHLERVLTGQAELYYSDLIFHPQGISLAFRQFSLPHALAQLALWRVMPAPNAYNLLFLLMLCFNGYCAYALILHLLRDKWIALFGAAVFLAATPFPQDSTIPDLVLTGLLPLTILFLRRALLEGRWRLAAMAGFCASLNLFIGIYVFIFIMLTAGVLVLPLLAGRWRGRDFWLLIALFVATCGGFCALRLWPMFADAGALREGLGAYHDYASSGDLLDFFVNSRHPLLGPFWRAALNPPPDAVFKNAYLGFVNLFLAGCAFALLPRKRRLLPWLALLMGFATLRLGQFLSVNWVEYRDIALPERFLSELLPPVFGNIGISEYYQIGAVLPLAVLSSFGLAALLRSRSTQTRAALALAASCLVLAEYYVPPRGMTLGSDRAAYIEWLERQPEAEIKLINLPQGVDNPHYYEYLQTVIDAPYAFGFSNRNPGQARSRVADNLLLNAWRAERAVHCLPHNQKSFRADLERLLADGFTHIVLHHWRWGDQFINPGFAGIPAAYEEGDVRVFHLSDLALGCVDRPIDLPQLRRFSLSPLAIPGPQSSILSYHPSAAIDAEQRDYLESLFADWMRFDHIIGGADLDRSAQDSQVLYLVYAGDYAPPADLYERLEGAGMVSCGRDAHEDGAIIERMIRRGFACELLTATHPQRVEYDKGAVLENLLLAVDGDALDVQFLWSGLPAERHSVSLQVFDSAGEKALGQDHVIGDVSLARHRLDLAGLRAGQYRVMLIVYNAKTNESVGGLASGDGNRFGRELEIAAFEHK